MKSTLLETVRIVDLTTREGWDCGRFLASLGAEVIRVDLPGAVTDEDWSVGQADKHCVTIDYEGDGKPLLQELIAGSAMVIESFMPGRMGELGLGQDALLAANPRLVTVSITPFGQTGPYAHLLGNELVVSALSGSLSMSGFPDSAPVKEAGDALFYHAAMVAAAGGMAALRHARLTGEGQQVDVSAQEVAQIRNTISSMQYQFDKNERGRLGIMFDSGRGPTRGIWDLKEGHAVASLMAPGSPGQKAAAAWMKENGFANPIEGVEANPFRPDPELVAKWLPALSDFLETRERDEVIEKALTIDTGILPVNEPRHLLDDEHLADRGFLKQREGDGPSVFPEFFVKTDKMDTSRVNLPSAPVAVGSISEIEALASKGDA